MITVPNKQYPFLWDPLNWILERMVHMHVPSHIWWLAGIWADHVRLYNAQMLVSRCNKVGFRVENIWHATQHCIPFEHFLLYGIGKNLVEKGLLKSAYRFSPIRRMSSVSQIIRRITYGRDALNTDEDMGFTSMNIVVKLRK
jgi:hypothetical protein